MKPEENSKPFAAALASAGIIHELTIYDEQWAKGYNHAFEPSGDADKKLRKRALEWLQTHMPAVGV